MWGKSYKGEKKNEKNNAKWTTATTPASGKITHDISLYLITERRRVRTELRLKDEIHLVFYFDFLSPLSWTKVHRAVVKKKKEKKKHEKQKNDERKKWQEVFQLFLLS